MINIEGNINNKADVLKAYLLQEGCCIVGIAEAQWSQKMTGLRSTEERGLQKSYAR